MSDARIGLVFLPGAGLGGWIWEGLVPTLDLPYLFAEYPRDGDRTLEDYAAHVREQIAAFDVDRVVLVAHSLGGVVGLKVSELLSARLAGFVGVSAAIPAAGGSFVSALPFAKRALVSVLMRVVGTKPPESAIRQGMCGDLSVAQADEVVRRFTPESRAVYIERTDAPIPAAPRMYVRLTGDKEFAPPMQAGFAHNLGADEVRELATGHLPMLSAPEELARVLNDFTARLGVRG